MVRLSDASHRLTESRRAVVELALKKEGLFTAADLYEDVRREAPGVGRATVFRTLDLLTGYRFLEKIHLGENCHSYVVCQERHHHHLLCSVCGKVVDFENCGLSDLLEELAKRTDFQITGHWLEVTGRCSSCQVFLSQPSQDQG